MAQLLPTALDRMTDGIEQHGVLERLHQELDRAGFHRLDAHRHIAVAGDEDDRHLRPFGELLLEIETVESGQRHVEHEAARNGDARMGQKVLCRREQHRLPPGVLDQQLQRFAHRHVVIDDEDEARNSGDPYHRHLPRNAASKASLRAASLKGLNRHSTAPLAIRSARIVSSRCAVMKTIGTFWRRRTSSC